MITPRRTRLVRVPDLRAFQRAIAAHACPADVREVCGTAVIVSTQAAASQLRHTLENLVLLDAADRQAAAWPDIVTREAWYERLHHASAPGGRQLSPIEREVLMARAARQTIAAGRRPPFRVRPALVAEMVAFLDAMLRLGRTLDTFERLLVEELEPRVTADRGAERLLAQTRFLVAAFRGYRDLVAASGRQDEHALREQLLQQQGRPVFTRVIVTVGDRSCGPGGLWPTDFDLLARLPGLEHIDLIATDAMLASGLHERLHDLLPGFDEVEFGLLAGARADPSLIAPADADTRWWTSRDREEEIATIARRIKRRSQANRRDAGAIDVAAELARPPVLDRIAIVCRRPLPYVYLAQSHLGAAGVPFQAFDDLPLAAEPFAAALELVFRFVESGFTRQAAVALLRSPHFVFSDEEGEIGRDAVRALEVALREAGGDGGIDGVERAASQGRAPEATRQQRAAVRAAAAAARAARELEVLAVRTPKLPASAQFEVLRAFCDTRVRPSDDASPIGARTARARSAILDALRQFITAHRTHDDPPVAFAETASRFRQWMEAQTFSPRTGDRGVHVLDAEAARYGDFDRVHLVGLIEREWPDKVGRTIFYPLTLLNQLGWPPERLRLAASRAAFRDLVRLARTRVSVSTFLLEDDAIVEPSPFLDELDRSSLPRSVEENPIELRILADDALSLDPVRTDVLGAAAWAELRRDRRGLDAPRFHGSVGAIQVKVHAVRRLETYLDCPFKYLAESVLGLSDESDDDPNEGPRAHGKFLHDVLAAFFERWQASGQGAITVATLDAARTLFAELVEARVAKLALPEAALWRARLLGSSSRAGVGEVILRAEAARSEAVRERLLEQRLDGVCVLQGEGGAKEVHARGIADRIDVLEGGRLRIIDYKLGRAPDLKRAIQLPVYAAQARAHFAALGQEAALADAAYLAFGEREPYVALTSKGVTLDEAIAEGQARALDAIEHIERGDLGAAPASAFLCSYCPYAALCRKEYADGR